MTTVATPSIRRAQPDDLTAVTAVLTEAFLHGDLAPWLIAPLEDRQRIYPAYFTLLARHALDHGEVDITGDRLAVAVWHTSEQLHAEITDYPAQLAQITAPYTARFAALDDAMHRHHPREPHHYLAFLAVHPDRQSHGLGGRLLQHRHQLLDAAGIAAYLEATGPRNQRLYARHGYESRPEYAVARNGPHLHPMWRPARGPAAADP
jgi:predicted N-acetyltransferase YhbS